MSIVERRYLVSFTPSGVCTARSVLPSQSTASTKAGTFRSTKLWPPQTNFVDEYEGPRPDTNFAVDICEKPRKIKSHAGPHSQFRRSCRNINGLQDI